MASLKFEGDLDGAREKQLQFIREVLHKRGFVNNKVVFESATQAGDNYGANVKRISVIGEGGQCFKMIAKLASENEALRSAFNIRIMFTNEIAMYEEILPKFASLQKSADVSDEDLYRFPECYGCLAEEPNEVVLIEDLKPLGYGMLDRLSFVNDDTIRPILKQLAFLHSLSFVTKKLEPKTYDSLKTKLVDRWAMSNTSEEFNSLFSQLEKQCLAIVGDDYKDVIGDLLPQTTQTLVAITAEDKNCNDLVLLHGDSWITNILLKSQNGEPADCIMIDYQLSREGKLVTDILHMVLTSTDPKTRNENYFNWMDYYHDQFDGSLANFGMEAHTVYPKHQFYADLRRYSKLYFGITVTIYSVLFRKPEEAKEVQDALKEFDREKMENNLSLDSLSGNTVLNLKSRIESLVDSFRLFGYL